ncbi:MAG: hypothetical protein ACI8VT_002106 [Saprospiraceae bacterium]|jgi:hypothetical protein
MINPGQVLLLKFDEDQVKISSSKSIITSNVKVGPNPIRPDVVWEIAVIKFIPNESRLFAEIINYQVRNEDFSTTQENIFKSIDIKKINFKKIETLGLLQSVKKKIITVTRIPNLDPPQSLEELKELELTGNQEDRNDYDPIFTQKKETENTQVYKEKQIDIKFEMPIKNIAFGNGFIKFNKFIPEANQKVAFVINNDKIKEEYDSIKNYFSNYLENKKIDVVAKITFNEKEILKCIASSEELQKLDESAIESVKFKFIESSFIKINADHRLDKNIFTVEELYDSLTNKNTKSSAFHASEMDLVKDLIESQKSKHYKQLRFLSSKHLGRILKLRFIVKPFSFIFLMENEYTYFIVWETLNTTEATYIWKVKPKEKASLKNKLSEIDSIIGQIREGSKRDYLNSKPVDFNRIYHDYSDKTGGFINWKTEIEHLISKD